MSKSIKQVVQLKISPKTIYDALMSSAKHSAFTEDKAVVSKKVGGKFSTYSGYISGINVELKPGKRIVQAWRGSDFPEGVYSIVTFDLEKTKNGTKITFTQHGVPANAVKNLTTGWHEYYWNKLKAAFEK